MTFEGQKSLILTDRTYGVYRIGLKDHHVAGLVAHQNCEAVHIFESYVIAACPNLVIYDFKTQLTMERGSPDIFPQDILVDKN